MNSIYRFLFLTCCVFVPFFLTSCATPENPDPLEGFNRKVFAFNEGLDAVILRPAAGVYKKITPEPLDRGVTNFFSNLNDITVIVNDLLQGKMNQAASDTARFTINSTLGLLGLIDLATPFGYPKHYEDFGQTLGHWGVDSGAYLVLPLFGPSSLRDGVGFGVDSLTDPRTYIANNSVRGRNAVLGARVLEAIDLRADLMGAEDVLDTAATDRYTYLRDAYLQRRDYLVRDGELSTDEESFDDLFDDLDDFETSPEPSVETEEEKDNAEPTSLTNDQDPLIR